METQTDQTAEIDSGQPSASPSQYELTWRQRLNYSWAETGIQLTAGGILKQLFFCTDIVGLQPARAGTAVLLGRVWDAFNDPLVGQLSDRTRSSVGRRRSWIGAGIVPMGITYFLLWCVSPNWNMNFAFWFMVLMPMLHNTFQTMVATPYASMSAEITFNYHERTILSGIRTFIHSIFFGFAFAYGPVVAQNYFSSQRVGYVTLSAIFAVVVIVGGFLTFFKTRERAEFNQGMTLSLTRGILIVLGSLLIFVVIFLSVPRIFALFASPALGYTVLIGTGLLIGIPILYCFGSSFVGEIAHCFTNLPFVLFFGADLLKGICAYIYVTSFEYLGKYYLGGLETTGTMLLIMVFSYTFFVPLWTIISRKIGKKNAYLLVLLIMPTVILSGYWLVEPSEKLLPILNVAPLHLIYILLGGFAFTGHVMIAFALIPEIVDYDELRTGKRREGAYFSFYTFLGKLAGSLSAYSAGAILQRVGYVANEVVQSPETIEGIRRMFSIYPGLIMLPAPLIFIWFPITRKRARQIREKLDARSMQRDEPAVSQ